MLMFYKDNLQLYTGMHFCFSYFCLFVCLSFVLVSYLFSPVSPAPPQVGELHRLHPSEAAVRALLAWGRRYPRRAAASGHRGLGPVRLAFRAVGGATIILNSVVLVLILIL